MRIEISIVSRNKEVSVGQLFSDEVINVDFMFCHGFAVRKEWQEGVSAAWQHGQSLRRGTYIFSARKMLTDLVVIYLKDQRDRNKRCAWEYCPFLVSLHQTGKQLSFLPASLMNLSVDLGCHTPGHCCTS